MILTIAAILFLLWLFGFWRHLGGNFIHILLVVSVIVIIINLLSNRRM
jgi:hypothetical protein